MNNEFLKMQKLAGLITEGEFKANLNEMSEETLVSTLEENGFEVVPNPAWIVRNSETGDDYILYTESGDYISHKLVGNFPEGVKIMGEGADDWLEQFLETEKKAELNENQSNILSFLESNKSELFDKLAKKFDWDEDDIEFMSEEELGIGADADGNEDVEIAGLGEAGLDFSFNPKKVEDTYGDASNFKLIIAGKPIYGISYNM